MKTAIINLSKMGYQKIKGSSLSFKLCTTNTKIKHH